VILIFWVIIVHIATDRVVIVVPIFVGLYLHPFSGGMVALLEEKVSLVETSLDELLLEVSDSFPHKLVGRFFPNADKFITSAFFKVPFGLRSSMSQQYP
jgi:hypothetical protein